MSIENPTPKDIPPRKRRPPANFPLDNMGFIKDPKLDDEVIRKITCGCETHEYSACIDIFNSGLKTPKAITDVYLRYADMNEKMHRAYLEQGNKRVWELAENILKEEH